MDYIDINRTNLGYRNREALEELKGTGEVVEVHSHSDYNGLPQAYNECLYEGWVKHLKASKCKYIELYGGYGTIWLYVKVVGNNGHKLKSYYHILHLQYELDNYPVWDDKKLSNKEWEVTKENAQYDVGALELSGCEFTETSDITKMIMSTLSNGWAGNSAANTFHDNMSSENYLSDDSIEDGLKALGYRQNPDTDVWYKPVQLIEQVTICVLGLTQVKAFAWWQLFSNGIAEVTAMIHYTVGNNDSTNVATLAYDVIDHLSE